MKPESVTCPYCSRAAQFLPDSRSIYHGRDYGPVYRCDPCDAHVGVHKGTTKPLGRLANAELRGLKRQVHDRLDPLWVQYWRAYPDLPAHIRSGHMRSKQRGRVYAWLAEQLGIPADDCHVGHFDPDRCLAAIAIFDTLQPTPADIRAWAKAKHGEEAA